MATQITDFVNSKSMITPGLAGSVVMFITNAIDMQFGCGGYLPHFVLGFSFLIGIVVFMDEQTSGISKIAFYILNSLIIFAVASGTNTIGYKATSDKDAIVPTIERIGFLIQKENPFEFHFVQQLNIAPDKELETRRQLLQSQIINTSTNIQLIQNDLVANQKTYNDPEGKYGLLKRINEDLEAVDKLVKTDVELKNERIYQEEILNIQENLQKLQGALLIEKKKPTAKRKFFKAWF